MVTVHREAGFQFRIYTDDHGPPHVHVRGQGHAKIHIVGTSGAPEMIYAEGVKASEERKMMRIVSEQQAHLLKCWEQIHGDR